MTAGREDETGSMPGMIPGMGSGQAFLALAFSFSFTAMALLPMRLRR